LTHVILTGFMATGKTAVGRCLAGRLRRPFLDLDEQIESREGRSIAKIFAEDGEEAFRRIESETVAALVFDRPSVIATGGGTFLDAGNRRVLCKLGVVVCLVVSFDTILRRVKRKPNRPLAKGADAGARLHRLWEQRMEAYKKADVLVETDGLNIEQATARVLASVEPSLCSRRGGDDPR